MITYSEFQPTGFDPKGLGLQDRQDWLVSTVAHNRDSNLLDESNWETQIKELENIDPDSNDHEIHRFGHWANGWFEIVIVRPGSPCANKCQDFSDSLSDYPILDGSLFSDKEWEEIHKYWENESLKYRVLLCQETGANVFSARRDDVPELVYEKLRDIVNQ